MSGKSLRADVIKYAKEKFGDEPDRPWIKYPENEVLRHSCTKKALDRGLLSMSINLLLIKALPLN